MINSVITKENPNRKWVVLAVIAAVIIGVGWFMMNQANKIPALQEKVKAQWSQVLNNYQRRSDLIPNLVSVVKGYAAHEQSTFQAVVDARAKVGTMQLSPDILANPETIRLFQENQQQLQGSLSRLIAITENYPTLKADKNFLELQSQLEGTENRIAVARRDFILAVQEYNTFVQGIPGRWIASWLYPDAKPLQNFTVDPVTQNTPTVNFN